MHNVIIPSGRVQNRQLGNQSVAVISLLIQQKKKYDVYIIQSCNSRIKIHADTLGCVRLDFIRKIHFPGLNYDKYLASRLTTLFPLTNHAN